MTKRTNMAGPTFLIWKGASVSDATDPKTGAVAMRIGKLSDALAVQTNDEYGIEHLARSIARKDGAPVYVARLDASTYIMEDDSDE